MTKYLPISLVFFICMPYSSFAQTWEDSRASIQELKEQKQFYKAEQEIMAVENQADQLPVQERLEFYLFADSFYRKLGYFNKQLVYLTKASGLAEEAYAGDKQKMFSTDKRLIWEIRTYVSGNATIDNYKYAISWFNAQIGPLKNRYGEYSVENAWIYSVFAGLLSDYGDIERAVAIAEEVLNILPKLTNTTKEDKIYVLIHRVGLIYYTNGDLEKAIFYYKKALDLIVNEQGENTIVAARANCTLSEVYNSQNNGTDGLSYGLKALSIIEDNGLKEKLSFYYNAIGVSYSILENYEASAEAFKKAIAESKGFIYAWPSLSKVYLKQGNVELAQAALDSAYRIFNYEEPLHFNELTDISIFPNVLEIRKNIWKAQYEKTGDIVFLERCEQVCYEICQLYLRNIGTFNGELNKQKLYAEAIAYNNEAIDICYTIHQKSRDSNLFERIFYYAEINRSLLLLESVLNKKILQMAVIPDGLEQRASGIRSEITRLEKEQFESNQDSGIPQQLFHLREYYNIVKDSIQFYCRDYYKNDYSIDITAANLVEKTIDPMTSFVEYTMTDSFMYIILINKGLLDVKRTPADALLKQTINDLVQNISHISEDGYVESISTITTTAHRAFQLLIEPVQELLHPKLIIVTNGMLDYLPFDVLLTAPVTVPGRFHQYPFLIKEYSISYNYSAGLWKENLEDRKQQPGKNLLAVAPFFEGVYTINDDVNVDSVVNRNQLEALPFSGEEVYRLAKIMNGDVLTGGDANYEDIREIMGEFRFLHFATHGKANDMKGDFSYIAFRKKSDPKECALLYVREIYNLPLKAELVVLSACETGIGEAQTGEGLISIARAFTYSGAKSVLTTLWPVNDEKTKEIMLYFYENLKAGLPKDTAIQKAKLSFLDKNKSTQSHPFYWAGFKFIGNSKSID